MGGETIVGRVELQLVAARGEVGDVVEAVAGGAAQDEGVVADPAFEDIVAGIASEDVVEVVAGGVDIGRTRQGQVLDEGAQLVGDVADHRVGAAGVDAARLLDGMIVRRIDVIGVVAGAAVEVVDTGSAIERVVAAQAGQAVVAAVTGDDIVLGGARAVDGGGSRQGQVLDADREDVADRAEHRIGAALVDTALDLKHVVGGRADDIGVVARAAVKIVDPRPAVEGVVTAQARQLVVAGVAGDDVAEAVARTVEIGRTAQGQVLDIGRKTVVDGTEYRIGAALVDTALDFKHVVGGRADDIGVVARAAVKIVDPRPAVEHVIAAVAGQLVVAGIAGDGVAEAIARAVDIGRTGQDQVLDIGRQAIADGTLHQIDAAVIGAGDKLFGNKVGGGADDIGVVARAAVQRAAAGLAVKGVVAAQAAQHVIAVTTQERVVAGIAGQDIAKFVACAIDVSRAGQGEVLDIGAECPGDGTADRVGAFTGKFGDDIGRIRDIEGVVALAAVHGVGARAAVQHVVAGTTEQGVRSGETMHDIIAAERENRVGTGGAVDDVIDRRTAHIAAAGQGIEGEAVEAGIIAPGGVFAAILGIGAIEMLDGGDVQRRQAFRAAGLLRHDGCRAVVRRQLLIVVDAGGIVHEILGRMLETERMADLVQQQAVVEMAAAEQDTVEHDVAGTGKGGVEEVRVAEIVPVAERIIAEAAVAIIGRGGEVVGRKGDVGGAGRHLDELQAAGRRPFGQGGADIGLFGIRQ